jgi:hypothetical protein
MQTRPPAIRRFFLLVKDVSLNPEARKFALRFRRPALGKYETFAYFFNI